MRCNERFNQIIDSFKIIKEIIQSHLTSESSVILTLHTLIILQWLLPTSLLRKVSRILMTTFIQNPSYLNHIEASYFALNILPNTRWCTETPVSAHFMLTLVIWKLAILKIISEAPSHLYQRIRNPPNSPFKITSK